MWITWRDHNHYYYYYADHVPRQTFAVVMIVHRESLLSVEKDRAIKDHNRCSLLSRNKSGVAMRIFTRNKFHPFLSYSRMSSMWYECCLINLRIDADKNPPNTINERENLNLGWGARDIFPLRFFHENSWERKTNIHMTSRI